MLGLGEANPNLAALLRRTVEAIHSALDMAVESEQTKVLMRVVAYTNAFTILRTLDMQMRRMQPQIGGYHSCGRQESIKKREPKISPAQMVRQAHHVRA